MIGKIWNSRKLILTLNTNDTYLWQNFGLIRYARKNPAVKTYWVQTTPNRKTGPGFLSCKNVIKCILSFSASSSNVWIQPWSLCIRRSEWRCRTIAAVNPGTPKSRIGLIFIYELAKIHWIVRHRVVCKIGFFCIGSIIPATVSRKIHRTRTERSSRVWKCLPIV